VDTALNVADLGTRKVEVSELMEGSTWQLGQPWMRLPREEMPIRTAAQVTLSAEEARLAAEELQAKDVRGHCLHLIGSTIADRYSYSKYVVDPCRYPWTKSVRIVSLVFKFIQCCRIRRAIEKQPGEAIPPAQRTVILTEADVMAGEEYFYKKATKEVYRFAKPKDYRSCSTERGGILYFSGRLLSSGEVNALEQVMFDLTPTSFARPVADRYSPVAYSVMLEAPSECGNHLQTVPAYHFHHQREGPGSRSQRLLQLLQEVQSQNGRSRDGADP
jgi:hypothetical protein